MNGRYVFVTARILAQKFRRMFSEKPREKHKNSIACFPLRTDRQLPSQEIGVNDVFPNSSRSNQIESELMVRMSTHCTELKNVAIMRLSRNQLRPSSC